MTLYAKVTRRSGVSAAPGSGSAHVGTGVLRTLVDGSADTNIINLEAFTGPFRVSSGSNTGGTGAGSITPLS
jgi:hypothetical protein